MVSLFDAGFRTFGDPVLKTPCQPIEDVDGKVVQFGQDLLARLQRSDLGIGLAANQIGVSRQAFAYDLSHYAEGVDGVLFNPRVTDTRGTAVYEEGCLSIPEFYYPVERADEVMVEGVTLAGELVTMELDGIAARLFQHEIDHLNGLLIFDRLPAEERKEAMKLATSLRNGSARLGRSRRLAL